MAECKVVEPQWDGRTYATHSQPQTRWAKELIAKQLKVSGHEELLDVGCGDGKITAFMAKELLHSGRAVGVDKSESQLEYARTVFTDIPNLSFQCADAADLPEEFKGRFDWATSFTCLHWLGSRYGDAFKSIGSCLKPGGQFLFTIPLYSTQQDQIQKKLREMEKWKPHIDDTPRFPAELTVKYSPDEQEEQKSCDAVTSNVIEKVRSAGFFIEHAEIIRAIDYFDNEQHMRECVGQWIPTSYQVPEELAEELLDDYLHVHREVVKDILFEGRPYSAENVVWRTLHVQIRAFKTAQ